MYEPLEGYLHEVEGQLKSLPTEARQEEISEMRLHLEALVNQRLKRGDGEADAVKFAIAQFGESQAVGRDLKKAMRRFSPIQVFLFSLPIVILALVFTMRIESQERLRSYYSHPFAPQLKIVLGKMRSNEASSSFRIDTNFLSGGGQGQSRWLVRGQLFDLSGEVPREVWNSQTKPGSATIQNPFRGGLKISLDDLKNPARPGHKATFAWKFDIYNQGDKPLKFVANAVAIALAAPKHGQSRAIGMSITEATSAQITVAQKQLGAQYFCEELLLKPKDYQQKLAP